MSDRFDHRCTEKECPFFGQRSTYGSCKCHQTREQMMMAHIENLERLEAVEPKWDSRSNNHDDILSTDRGGRL